MPAELPSVVMITASSDPGVRLECLQAGAMDFVTKPVEDEDGFLVLKEAFGAIFQATGDTRRPLIVNTIAATRISTPSLKKPAQIRDFLQQYFANVPVEDMQGRYVYIIKEDDTVARRNITLGLRDGVDWVVESGLEEGMRVIVNGVQKVRPGMTVTPSSMHSPIAWCRSAFPVACSK